MGERFAAWWLTQHGLTVVAANLAVDGGEIDLLMSDRSKRVVVEVRAVTGGNDPVDAIDGAKRRHVGRLAGKVGASRVDYVGIGFHHWGILVHWVPG